MDASADAMSRVLDRQRIAEGFHVFLNGRGDIADMIEKDAKEIFLVRNFRKKSISELCDKLEKLGFDCMNLRKLDFLL